MRRPVSAPRVLAALLSAALILSCTDTPTAPERALATGVPTATAAGDPVPTLVISQVYGGGGNSGATLRNDFIELFNPGSAPVSVDGWSVQYASAAGSSWQVTPLTGSIPAGGYYLVQEAQGSGGSASLPTPDATGTIAMAAGSGKVALSNSAAALTGACPAANLVDQVNFGASTDCGSGTTGAAISGNVTAAIRSANGCAFTGVLSADFTYGAPAPRNSANAVNLCEGGTTPEPAVVTVTPDSTGVLVGGTTSFAAAAVDDEGAIVGTTFTWASSDESIATVSASGEATGVSAGLATITATAANGVMGSALLRVTAPPPDTVPASNPVGKIVISQVYGGGGNAGATYRNDFIELFNRSEDSVDVTGWSVQYTSAAGSGTWQVTTLTGTIPPGGYFLVQEAQGSGGTVDLPTPDVVGTIAMGAAAGKVLLRRTATAATGACPADSTVVDQVSVGNGTTCGTTTAPLSNTLAALRKSGGCFYTPSAAADFVTGAPAPRNSATAPRSCVVGPLDHLEFADSVQVLVGATAQLAVTAVDASGNIVTTDAVTWASDAPETATVSATGLVTGVAASGTAANVTMTVTAGAVTIADTVRVYVRTDGINWIDVSSSSTSLPPGFQTQLFATARNQSGGTAIPATFTFEAVDTAYADVLNVQGTGLFVAKAPPPADAPRAGIRITATPLDGGTPYSFISRSITIEQPSTAPLSLYADNDEFGLPTPTGSDDDLLIVRPQYTLSYNQSRGTPNWVSYELDARHMVAGQDRCNCFTADPLLPAAKQLFTSDYTNGGFDRGHMTRSFDRTAANVDNATTFYLTNIIPQVADLNQGVWAQFENALGDSARAGRAVYIITGPLYTQGKPLTFVKNEGKVAIPDSVWKVALIGPDAGSLPFTRANLDEWSELGDVTLLAVNMPNVTGVRNDPWAMYLTTVPAIEASTGYDVLSLLMDGIEGALEYRDAAPVALFTVTTGPDASTPVTFDATASSDPDLGRTDFPTPEVLSFAWTFSDGTSASGAVVTRSFAAGTYTAILTVTDIFGWPSVRSETFTVAPIPAPPAAVVRHAPTMNGRLDGNLWVQSGESFALNGSASVSGTLFVPGMPRVQLNGRPTFGGYADGEGSEWPSNYTITLNGGASLGRLARRMDPILWPTVDAAATPTGTRAVHLNRATDPIGDWATLRNLTLNGQVGTVSVPAGAYGDFTLNGSNRIRLGVEGATTPTVYHFQRLTLNGQSLVEVVGPVIVTVGNAIQANGSMGNGDHPEWLTLQIAQGGLTLNGNVSVAATVFAPNGTVTVNGSSVLTGGVLADRLVLNGNALLRVTNRMLAELMAQQ